MWLLSPGGRKAATPGPPQSHGQSPSLPTQEEYRPVQRFTLVSFEKKLQLQWVRPVQNRHVAKCPRKDSGMACPLSSAEGPLETKQVQKDAFSALCCQAESSHFWEKRAPDTAAGRRAVSKKNPNVFSRRHHSCPHRQTPSHIFLSPLCSQKTHLSLLKLICFPVSAFLPSPFTYQDGTEAPPSNHPSE